MVTVVVSATTENNLERNQSERSFRSNIWTMLCKTRYIEGQKKNNSETILPLLRLKRAEVKCIIEILEKFCLWNELCFKNSDLRSQK